MKLYYSTAPVVDDLHHIYYAVLDTEDFTFSHSTQAAMSTLDIDEIEDNKTLCQDIRRYLGKRDAEGDPKYHVKTDLTIVEKEGWTEHVDL